MSDSEKLVSELKERLSAQEETMQEREARHSKTKAVAATLQAKLNTANLELQRLREEVCVYMLFFFLLLLCLCSSPVN